MKNLKTYLIVVFIFTLCSCDKDDAKEEEPKYLYAGQILYSGAVAEKRDLAIRQDEIFDAIDNDEALLEEFNYNKQRIINLEQVSEYIKGLNPSIGPRGPVRFPPVGCLEVANCKPTVNLSNIEGIVLHNDIKITQISLFNTAVNDVIGTNFVPGDQFSTQETLMFTTTDFTDISRMEIHISINGGDGILVKVPVIIE